MRPRRQLALWAAIVLSLGLHLAALLAVRAGEVSEKTAKKPPGELVFVEVEATTPPPPESPRPQPAPATKRVLRPAPSPVEPVAPVTPKGPTADAVMPDAPVDAPRVNLALVPKSTFGLPLDAGLNADSLTVVQKQSAQDLVGSLAKETLGRGRVQRGLVHSYYIELGKTLIKTWDADRVAKSGLKGFTEQTKENFKLVNEIWLDRAQAYAKSGSPIDGDSLNPNRRAPVTNQIQGISGIDLEARKEMQRQMSQVFKAVRRATIRVVQDRTGKLQLVELVEPSNDQNVDKEAMKDVRASAEKLPPPPEEVFEGRDQISSLWSFELIVSISPPIPTVTFEFDEALGVIDTRLPLDRRIYKKVRLVSVE